ncbi:MAG: TadE family protein [Ilumatobacteraceae bacterium]
MKTDSGSVTVEMVLLTPVLMVLILFGIYSGRASESLTQVRSAADQAARGAAKVSRSRIETTAFQIAERALTSESISCIDFSVSTALVEQGNNDAVRVEISCTINTEGLTLLGLTQRRVTASSTEVLDRWRVDS